jgi:ferredoxin
MISKGTYRMGTFSFFDKILIPTHNDTNEMKPGEVEFDYGKCNGCPICVDTCPAGSILLKDGTPYLKPLGENGCIACGDCVAICPGSAIRLTKNYHFARYFKTIDQGELKPPRLFGDV